MTQEGGGQVGADTFQARSRPAQPFMSSEAGGVPDFCESAIPERGRSPGRRRRTAQLLRSCSAWNAQAGNLLSVSVPMLDSGILRRTAGWWRERGRRMFGEQDFPLIERAGGWEETPVLSEVTSQVRFTGDRSVAQYRAFPLGEVPLSALRFSSMLARRTPALVRQSDPDMYGLCVAVRAKAVFEHAHRNEQLSAGQMLLYDSALPFDAEIDGGRSEACAVVAQFPKKMLPFRERHLSQVVGEVLGKHSAVERLLYRFLVDLGLEGGHCTPHDRVRLQSTVTDLLSTALAGRLDRDEDVPHSTHWRVLFLRATAFIRDHLGRAELDPALVAAAVQVSVRTLNRIFAKHDTAVATFIREQRLERIRTDLATPHLHYLTVHAIAARWGYPEAPAFSRAFRTTFGEPPSEYRRRMHSCPQR
ncbi:helix-turn-helix domain-containing protein [Streptomyces sp. NPDC101181]|uniref:helix-turn-helix domain-containing protein n=1 Tax=Streptomyces sp. NPDC101181 TaxID=3366125 RepID=UPI0037F9FEA8